MDNLEEVYERCGEIDAMAKADPLGLLRKISRFEPPSDRWDISDVGYALRSIYDKIRAVANERGILEELENQTELLGDESE